MNRHSMRDARRAKETALGMMAKNSPVDPVMISMGMKAETVVRVAATMGRKTSEVPSTTASMRGLPSCRWRKMFSTTIMASSTMIPETSTKANSETSFRELPAARMMTMVSKKAKGTPTVVRQELRNPMNSQMSTNTRQMPSSRLEPRVRMESRTLTVEFWVRTGFTPSV